MFVIVEGIDRVGKTTLVNRICEELGFKKYNIRNQFPFGSQSHNVDVNEAIIGMMKVCDCNVVFDRFHMTELVYGYCDRGYNGIMSYYSINDELLHLKKCLLVLVKPTDIERSSREHGCDLTKHNELFEEMFECYHGKKIACDYNTMDKVIKFIKENMQ